MIDSPPPEVNIKTNKPNSSRIKKFDLVVLATIIFLGLTTSLLVWFGDRTNLQVNYFSWKNREIGLSDREFVIEFNRPVDKTSVEKNLTIEPPLEGKTSWKQGKLVYTTTTIPSYDSTYKIRLEGGKELISEGKFKPSTEKPEKLIEPFLTVVESRDRIIAYIGVEKEEEGKLILYNLTKQEKTLLTPADLIVTDFRIYPDSKKILFSAFDRASQVKGFLEQQLYTVTTGLSFDREEKKEHGGKLQRILDSKDYQNLRFSLSANGETIVIARVNRNNNQQSSLWLISPQEKPRPLGIPLGDFVLSQDGKTLGVAQNQTLAIYSLEANGGTPQYFPGYEKIVGFSPDGKKKLVTKYNPNYTRSLYLLDEQEQAKELFNTVGPSINCFFDPKTSTTIYCSKTDVLVNNQQYQVQPLLNAINLENNESSPLLLLPNEKDLHIDLSADGEVIIFDQITPKSITNDSLLLSKSGNAIATSTLWMLRLDPTKTLDNQIKIPPQKLITGFLPQWIP